MRRSRRLFPTALAGLSLISAQVSLGAIRFTDATISAGISGSGPTYGASWGDLNGDGRPDLWVGNHDLPPSLYLNAGGGAFVDVAPAVWPGPSRDTHGAAWADVDRDGDQDLVELVGGGNPNHLWINEAGTLVDRAVEWGIAFPGMRSRTPLWLDWNRDGVLDLFFAHELNQTDFPAILRGTAEKRFVDASAEAGVLSTSSHYGQLGDLTGDAKADLVIQGPFFPRFVYDTTTVPLVDVRDSLSLDEHGDDFGADAAIADFNGDGHNDLFFTKNGANAQLLVRDPRGFTAKMVGRSEPRAIRFRVNAAIDLEVHPWFSEVPEQLIEIGAAAQTPSSFSLHLDPRDSTVTGLPALPGRSDRTLQVGFDETTSEWTILFTGLGQQLALEIASSEAIEDLQAIDWDPDPLPLWPNYYEGSSIGFVELRVERGLGQGFPCRSVVAGDFDNDMDLDIFLACTRPATNAQNLLLENDGHGTFDVVTHVHGAEGTMRGRSESVAVADYDQDGFLDLFVTNGLEGPPFNEGPHQLFHNIGNSNHWVEFDLVGCASSHEAIGAVVSIEAGGVEQRRLQDGGMHRRSQNHTRLHFGLGSHERVERAEVRWPSGALDVWTDLSGNQVHVLAEGGGSLCAQKVPTSSRVAVLLVSLLLMGLGGAASWFTVTQRGP